MTAGDPVTLQNQTDALRIQDRRHRVFELKKAGFTYQEIADHLAVSVTTVRHDVHVTLDEYNQLDEVTIAEYRRLELERLDVLQKAIWPRASSGNIDAGRQVLRISEQRAKLLGLYAPLRISLDALIKLVAVAEARGYDVDATITAITREMQQEPTLTERLPPGQDQPVTIETEFNP